MADSAAPTRLWTRDYVFDIGVNFLVEFGLNVVLCPAIARIIDVVRHTAKKNAQEEEPADVANGDGEENA